MSDSGEVELADRLGWGPRWVAPYGPSHPTTKNCAMRDLPLCMCMCVTTCYSLRTGCVCMYVPYVRACALSCMTVCVPPALPAGGPVRPLKLRGGARMLPGPAAAAACLVPDQRV